MRFKSVLGVIGIATLVWAAGCERDVETVRAELAAKQASWQRGIEAFKAQHAAIGERLARQPMAAAAGWNTPAVKRMRLTLDGFAQSLVDVEIQMRQVGSRVEQALGRGRDAAHKALDEDGERMNGYLQALADNLAATGRALDDLGKTETSRNENEQR